MLVTKLEQMIELAKTQKKRKLVVAYGQDPNTIAAINKAVEIGLVDVILVGDQQKIKILCQEKQIDSNKFEIVHEPDEMQSAIKSVQLVREKRADFIMKGLVSTDKYMRAILDKEKGLLPPKAVLSHVSVIETPKYHKLLIVGDVAIIPNPDLNQKIAITNYLVKTAHKLGISTPKVAIISATEKANPKMQSCVDAAIISKMGDRGQIKGALIDGPLALDVAVDKVAADLKGITSEVAGDADCLLFPNIETGNVFYKTMTKLSDGVLAAVVVGTEAAAILPSRGD
ncbi:MAG: phosphate acyltransferase, partial [Candidatus Cloacimonetes bacterium]|nr:phosphate acyltransferase [Candidatus Cloacimonadota bacterium]